MGFWNINKNKPLFFFLVTLSITLILLGVYWGFSASQVNSEMEVVEKSVSSPSFLNSESRYTVVFLGRGGEGHSGGTLTDSIIVLSVDAQAKKALSITIPRDLWAPIPYDWDNYANFKINEAYNIGIDNIRYANKLVEYRGENGAGNLVKKVVEDITDLKIDYYVDINFDNFVKVVDALGGIKVNVPKSFKDPFYPIRGLENETCGISAQKFAEFHQKYSGFDLEKQFTCRYEEIAYEKGEAKMTGEEALKFVRSRHGDSDFGRSERQIALLEGVLGKLVSLNALKNNSSLVKNLFEFVKTDLDLPTTFSLIDFFGNPEKYNLTKIYINEENFLTNSSSKTGQFILVPKKGLNDFSEIRKTILEAI